MRRPFFSGFSTIFRLAFPLILTTSSHMIMQFVDSLFLSWYGTEAVAAVGPAGMLAWLIICPFHGTVNFVGTLVAQYTGAQQRERPLSVLIQGIYFACGAGILLIALAWVTTPIFGIVGHAPTIQSLEKSYFFLLCTGSIFTLISGAMGGYFSGLHKTNIIFFSQLIGGITNLILDWILIFGHYGAPELGIRGAAIATILAQLVTVLVYLPFIPSTIPSPITTFRISFQLETELFLRLLRFGFPNGLRSLIEMTAWTAFLFFIGRIGTTELMVTNIVWRINGIAFLPMMGLSSAIGILVGNAQGQKNFSESFRVTIQGLVITQVWMTLAALSFVLFPKQLLLIFYNSNTMNEQTFLQLIEMGTILLRLVAIYSLVDGFNVIFIVALQSAGDTRWTFFVSCILHLIFLGSLWYADRISAGLYVEWTIATVFVIVLGLVWLKRFLSGQWKHIQVIEYLSPLSNHPSSVQQDTE